jgi:hypothetical protein
VVISAFKLALAISAAVAGSLTTGVIVSDAGCATICYVVGTADGTTAGVDCPPE